MSILVLSSASDQHVKAVAKELKALSKSVYCLPLDELLAKWRLQFELSQSGFSSTLKTDSIKIDGDDADIVSATSSLDLKSIEAIWFRRPNALVAKQFPEPWMKSFAQWESERALQAIWRILPCRWVNHPASQREALYKLHQLEVARQVGLSIPRTLVTNDPQAVEAFYHRCDGKLIYKLIDENSSSFAPISEACPCIPTLPFRETDLKHIKQVSFSLHLFQEHIDKQCDLRVTVVGRKIFAVEIESQKGLGNIDWRLDYSVPMKVYNLADQVSQRCFALLQKLGLNFGAIDLCLDKNGRYYFFEVNPAGQWLWMEIALGIPVSSALSQLLAGLEQPLVPWL